jgi:GNAT superfamily N-acetyltransferase
MAPPGVRIRPARTGELDRVLGWAAEEGWNPGRADASRFWPTDPGGFLVAEADGEPLGSISAVRYGHAFGFMGLYLVRPEHRGKGIGHSLWLAAIARLAGRTIGIEGVPALQDEYRAWGFEPAYRHVHHRAPAGRLADGPAIAVEDARTIDPAQVDALDGAGLAVPRPDFARRWTAPPHRALVALAGGRPIGLGVVRPCRTGHRIGPLIAPDPAVARGLVTALAAALGADDEVAMDVPDANRDAIRLARDLGMWPSTTRVRMFSGPPPRTELAQVYAAASLDLG